MNSLYSLDKWLDPPYDNYKSYLLIKIVGDKNYIIISDEYNAFIYRNGYLESGGNFKVYRYYKGMCTLENEGFGSPTYLALFIGDLENILKVSTNVNIVDLNSGNIVIYKKS